MTFILLSFNLSSFNPHAENIAPPSSLVMTQPAMDTLSTVREVNTNPPSPESPHSGGFPRLVVSPPLFCEADLNVSGSIIGVAIKPYNSFDSSTAEEIPSLETPRWFLSLI